MNSRNSHAIMRLVPMIGLLGSVLVGSVSMSVFGEQNRLASMIAALIAGLLLLASLAVSAVFLYHGVLRAPATARTARIREQLPAERVWAVDMDKGLREWLRAHRLPGADDARVSRFGGNVSADEEGLTFWVGTGSEPTKSAFVEWAGVSEIRPPAAGDFIGASTPQTALTIGFAGAEPDLRILFLLDSLAATGASDYADACRVAGILERFRADAQRAQGESERT